MVDGLRVQQLHKVLEAAQSALVVVHRRPDGDALGSMAAFVELGEHYGIDCVTYCSEISEFGDSLSFVYDTRNCVTNSKLLSGKHFDVVVVLDCGDLKHAGMIDVLPQLQSGYTLVNIDHHATNDSYGDIAIVHPDASSTTEILYDIIRMLHAPISQHMATALLTGVLTDTMNFSNANTTPDTLRVASALLYHGAQIFEINGEVLANKTIAIVKIWGTVLQRLRQHPELPLISTCITLDDLKGVDATLDVTEGIANFLNNVGGDQAMLIVQQTEPGLVKGSFRTNSNLIDVSQLAKLLGGGGHKKAAGFATKGTLVVDSDGSWKIV